MMKQRLKKLRILLFILVVHFSGLKLYSQKLYLIGPTLHYNIGGGIEELSWGIEFSFWNFENEKYSGVPPMGVDLGIEFARKKQRLYCELQAGHLKGLSAGYVYEFADTVNRGGFQFSVWAWYLGGIELRYRRINQKNYFSPGLLFKYPLNVNVFSIK